MGELASLALLGLVASGLGFALLGRSGAARRGPAGRLPGGGDEGERRAILGPLTPGLAGLLAGRESSREGLARELLEAGYYRPAALQEYLAVRAALVFAPPILALAASLLAPEERSGVAIALGVAGALLGFSLPRAVVRSGGRARRASIERALPVSVDLMTLGLAAGQGLPAALARSGRELSRSHPVLAGEVALTLRLAEFHGLESALAALADRVGGKEVRNLTLILRQADRLGTDAARALEEFTADYRVNLRQKAEARANRLSLLMLFPTIFCLLIAAAIVLIGPAYFEFYEGLRQVKEINAEAAARP